jgi:hypothetical protein
MPPTSGIKQLPPIDPDSNYIKPTDPIVERRRNADIDLKLNLESLNEARNLYNKNKIKIEKMQNAYHAYRKTTNYTNNPHLDKMATELRAELDSSSQLYNQIVSLQERIQNLRSDLKVFQKYGSRSQK